ncbi:unnamed protein product [Allacma fusca]|uniref:Uncharacterized protein n=1 Tax=Allacma fusca TaxID=39272 RepID=A0A8J2J951_9HEXA|nr:unnamed protein product [Allacma fusca]
MQHAFNLCRKQTCVVCGSLFDDTSIDHIIVPLEEEVVVVDLVVVAGDVASGPVARRLRRRVERRRLPLQAPIISGDQETQLHEASPACSCWPRSWMLPRTPKLELRVRKELQVEELVVDILAVDYLEVVEFFAYRNPLLELPPAYVKCVDWVSTTRPPNHSTSTPIDPRFRLEDAMGHSGSLTYWRSIGAGTNTRS